MTATAAKTGFGIKFGRETATAGEFEDLAELKDATPPGKTRETVDATHHGSEEGWREVIVALKSQKDATVLLHYIPGGTAWEKLNTDFEAGLAKKYKLTAPDGTESVIFSGYVIDLSPAMPIADVMTLSVTIKPTGKPTWS